LSTLSGYCENLTCWRSPLLSGGSITLRSNNPLDAPLINPNLIGHPYDAQAMLVGLRSAQRFLSAPAFADYVLDPVYPFTPQTINNDEAALETTRNFIQTSWHPVGTLAMSRRGAGYGVVDPDLMVKGLKGVRVVDASIMVSAASILPLFKG